MKFEYYIVYWSFVAYKILKENTPGRFEITASLVKLDRILAKIANKTLKPCSQIFHFLKIALSYLNALFSIIKRELMQTIWALKTTKLLVSSALFDYLYSVFDININCSIIVKIQNYLQIALVEFRQTSLILRHLSKE